MRGRTKGNPFGPASETSTLAAARPEDVTVVAGSRTWGLVDRTGNGNPFGRRIVLHDKMDSRDRVRDHMVFEVTRTSAGSCLTITVVESMEADDGK